MNCDKEPGWHTDTWRHQSTRRTARTHCHNCHKPTVTIVGMLTAELQCVILWGHRGGFLYVSKLGRCACTREHTCSFVPAHTHMNLYTQTHTDIPSSCPCVKILPNQFGLVRVQTMQPLRGTPFTGLQLGLHIPQLKTQTASLQENHWSSNTTFLNFAFFLCV